MTFPMSSCWKRKGKEERRLAKVDGVEEVGSSPLLLPLRIERDLLAFQQQN